MVAHAHKTAPAGAEESSFTRSLLRVSDAVAPSGAKPILGGLHGCRGRRLCRRARTPWLHLTPIPGRLEESVVRNVLQHSSAPKCREKRNFKTRKLGFVMRAPAILDCTAVLAMNKVKRSPSKPRWRRRANQTGASLK